MKGISRLVRSLGNEKAQCVVCDMLVSKKTRFTAIFRRKKYYFCCNDCKSSFTGSPYEYIKV